MRAIAPLAVLAVAACATPKPVYVSPTPRNMNVVPFDGPIDAPLQYHVQQVHVGAEVGVRVDTHPASALLADRGLTLTTSLLCGENVRVLATSGALVYGRLLVFAADPKGRGPAGRGEYLLQVPDERIAETTGGRTALAYESYVTTAGDERYAWIVWMAEQPIGCGDDHPVAPAGATTARVGGVTLVANGDEPRRALAYHPAAGSHQAVEITLDTTSDGGGGSQVSPTVVVTADLAIDAVGADGTINATLSLVDLVGRDAKGSPKGAAAQMTSALAAAKGATVALRVTPDGQVRPTSKTDALGELAIMIDHLVVPLPVEPVGDGASWRLAGHLEQGGISLDGAVDYRLVDGMRVEGQIATSAPAQEIDAQGTKVTIESFTGSGTLDAVVDLTRLVSPGTVRTTETLRAQASGRTVAYTTDLVISYSTR